MELNLLKSLGSFINKFYPHKKFVRDLLLADQENADQLELNLLEIANKLSYRKCPLTHTEKLFKIDLEERSTFLVSGIQLIAGEPLHFIETPIANDLTKPTFRLPSDLLSIETITDSIIDPKIVLKRDEDFVIDNELILFKEEIPNKSVWATTAKFDTDNLFNTVGFLFFDKDDCKTEQSREIIILLVKLLRYGLFRSRLNQFLTVYFGHPYILSDQETIQEIIPGKVITDKNEYTIEDSLKVILIKGNTYSALTPITDAVKIEDAQDREFFIKDKEPITHNIVTRPMKWNLFKYGIGRWGDILQVEDTFLTELKDEVIYTATVKITSNRFPLKYLSLLEKAVPVWMKLNILLETTNTEDQITQQTEAVETTTGKYISESYKSYQDGQFGIAKWGQFVWNSFKYLEPRLQTLVKVIKHYHD